MKKDYYCFTILENGKQLKMVEKRTWKGVSSYANKMIEKYNFTCKVEVYTFNENCEPILHTTFRA